MQKKLKQQWYVKPIQKLKKAKVPFSDGYARLPIHLKYGDYVSTARKA